MIWTIHFFFFFLVNIRNFHEHIIKDKSHDFVGVVSFFPHGERQNYVITTKVGKIHIKKNEIFLFQIPFKLIHIYTLYLDCSRREKERVVIQSFVHHIESPFLSMNEVIHIYIYIIHTQNSMFVWF